MGEKFKIFYRRNLSWLILFAIACLSIPYFRAVSARLDKKMQLVYESNNIESCFNDKIIIHWDKPPDMGKSIKTVCRKMDNLGIRPLRYLMIDIRVFEKCDRKIKGITNCSSYFVGAGARVSGYEAAFIYLPQKTAMKAADREASLAHELSHALVSNNSFVLARIVDEFFAVYAQAKLDARKIHAICNGKEWNDPVLATHQGEYYFPSDPENPLSQLVSLCRYGQLEYWIRRADKKDPLLFRRLWEKLKKHEAGKVGIELLKEWIKEVSPAISGELEEAFVLRQNSKQPSLAAMNIGNKYCFFAYQSSSSKKETFPPYSYIQVEIWEGADLVSNEVSANEPYICLDKGLIFSKDKLYLKALTDEACFYRVFDAP